MEGKICLITGANDGIGREVCFQLASKGAWVIMSARNRSQAERVRSEIILTTGNPNIHLFTADLSLLPEVVDLSEAFKKEFDTLDVLVNNAGIFHTKYIETPDGFETQWAVNYLAPYLLTRRLMEPLKAADKARIINVSSNAHRQGQINFQDLNGRKHYRGLKAYSQSKLANVLFTKELTSRLSDTGITSYSLHPGVVSTGIGDKHNHSWISWLWKLGKPFMIPPSRGAETIVYLASANHLSGLDGRYFINCQPQPSSEISNDPKLATQLWEVSEQLTQKYL